MERYLATGTPIASSHIAASARLDLAPASVRRILVDLTAEGYIEQPHTSAGRVPTRKGLRSYLDHLVTFKPLPDVEREVIEHNIKRERGILHSVMSEASSQLALHSHWAGFIVAHAISELQLTSLHLVPLDAEKVLAILVSRDGLLLQKPVSVDGSPAADDLVRMQNYLNSIIEGRSVSQVRSVIRDELRRDRAQADQFIRSALAFGMLLLAMLPSQKIVVENPFALESLEEVASREEYFALLRAIRDKERLLAILDEIGPLEQPSVIFPVAARDNMSIIITDYTSKSDDRGKVGLVGPIRIDYARLIPLVDFTARTVSDTLA